MSLNKVYALYWDILGSMLKNSYLLFRLRAIVSKLEKSSVMRKGLIFFYSSLSWEKQSLILNKSFAA